MQPSTHDALVIKLLVKTYHYVYCSNVKVIQKCFLNTGCSATHVFQSCVKSNYRRLLTFKENILVAPGQASISAFGGYFHSLRKVDISFKKRL